MATIIICIAIFLVLISFLKKEFKQEFDKYWNRVIISLTLIFAFVLYLSPNKTHQFLSTINKIKKPELDGLIIEIIGISLIVIIIIKLLLSNEIISKNQVLKTFYSVLNNFFKKLIQQFFRSFWGQVIVFSITILSILFAAYQDMIQSNENSMGKVMEMAFEKHYGIYKASDIDSIQIERNIIAEQNQPHSFFYIIDGSGSTNSKDPQFHNLLCDFVACNLDSSKLSLFRPQEFKIRELLSLSSILTIDPNEKKISILQYQRIADKKDTLLPSTEFREYNSVIEQFIKYHNITDSPRTDFGNILKSVMGNIQKTIKSKHTIHVILITDFIQDAENSFDNKLVLTRIDRIKRKLVQDYGFGGNEIYFSTYLLDQNKDNVLLTEWNSYGKIKYNQLVKIPELRNNIVVADTITFPYELTQKRIINIPKITIPFYSMRLNEENLPFEEIHNIIKKINNSDSTEYAVEMSTSPTIPEPLSTHLRLGRNGIIRPNKVEQIGSINKIDTLTVYNIYPNITYDLELKFIPNSNEGKIINFPITFQKVPHNEQHILAYFILILIILSSIPPLIFERVIWRTQINNDHPLLTYYLYHGLGIITIFCGLLLIISTFDFNFYFFNPHKFGILKNDDNSNYYILNVFVLLSLIIPTLSFFYFIGNEPSIIKKTITGTDLEEKMNPPSNCDHGQSIEFRNELIDAIEKSSLSRRIKIIETAVLNLKKSKK